MRNNEAESLCQPNPCEKQDQTFMPDPGPLADLNSFTIEELKDCKTTSRNQFGIYKAGMVFSKASYKAVTCAWDRIKGLLEYKETSMYQFPGQGSRPTPVATFSQLLGIFAKFPGERAKQLRTENARIRARAMAGDLDLVTAIESQRENIHPAIREVLLAGLSRSAVALAESDSELGALRIQSAAALSKAQSEL